MSRLIRKSIFDHLSRLCDLFDDDGSMAYKNHVYDLLAELLQYPILAKDFVENEDIGVRSLYNTAMENFPVDMISLSKLGVSLIKSSNLGYSFVSTILERNYLKIISLFSILLSRLISKWNNYHTIQKY